MKTFIISIMVFCVIIYAAIKTIPTSTQETSEYKNSMSFKQFLFANDYTLRVDGTDITKYDKTLDCKKDSIVELVQNGTIISGMIMADVDQWYKFPDTNVYAKLFSGG